MSQDVRISARFRKEPDYGRLARALLQFLEEQAEKEGSDLDQESGPGAEAPATMYATEIETDAEDQP
jgi:hypothetical protein